VMMNQLKDSKPHLTYLCPNKKTEMGYTSAREHFSEVRSPSPTQWRASWSQYTLHS
jgi:hypothetical protein